MGRLRARACLAWIILDCAFKHTYILQNHSAGTPKNCTSPILTAWRTNGGGGTLQLSSLQQYYIAHEDIPLKLYISPTCAHHALFTKPL